ncbi:MAG TPA: 50S ribosomal protein L18 [bacterium]|nr:50S ribosomal protein L18 [bacterium]HPT29923.1 50S ribosomal protein L18 [bacterium]
MNKQIAKNSKLERRHVRVRAKIEGTAARPRLNVFRSNTGLFLQLIDDVKGVTLVSADSKELKDVKKPKLELAKTLGELLAKKAQDKKISAVVFDRGGYRYHGRVKAVAEGARQGGLQF